VIVVQCSVITLQLATNCQDWPRNISSMSRRELKALQESQRTPPENRSRLRSGSCATMDKDCEKEELGALTADEQEKEQLETLVAELRTENAELIEESDRKDSQLSDLRAQVTETLATIKRLERQLEESRLTAELERLRVVDKLRDEHQEALKREQAQVDLERERVRSLTKTFCCGKSLHGEYNRRAEEKEFKLVVKDICT